MRGIAVRLICQMLAVADFRVGCQVKDKADNPGTLRLNTFKQVCRSVRLVAGACVVGVL